MRSDAETVIADIGQTSPGLLDGLTLFRFAHIRRDPNSGGVESYLSNLNRMLLHRNKMRILQTHLVQAGEPCTIEVEQAGRGELVWVPSPMKTRPGKRASKSWRVLEKIMLRLDPQHLVRHDLLLSSLSVCKPDVAVFHWISPDSRVVVDHVSESKIPLLVVNHFQNARLNKPDVRRQIARARAIGGVSAIGVPGFLREKFTNLSDGVDTDFFRPEKAVPLKSGISLPIILLPSRLIEGKGHVDAVRALRLLSDRGVSAVLAFAGITQSPALLASLQKLILEGGLRDRVIFAGGLTAEELRNWYAASGLVVLPSGAEGLPKVLLEAQAMEKPVVAYDVGGVPEAVRNSETGYLVRKGDIEGFAGRLGELVGNPGKRLEMGEQGRKFVVERFSMEALVTRHERFYAGHASS